jgi:hypothetical protein
MALVKGKLNLVGNKLTPTLKRQLREKINSPEGLAIYNAKRYTSKVGKDIIGSVVSVRFNDKKRSNTLMVDIPHDPFYSPDFDLITDWKGEITHVEYW